jgi:hypothetical protein
MNILKKTTFTAFILLLSVLGNAADIHASKDLSEVKLPSNSCSIKCPAGTKRRGQPIEGAAVTCSADSAPLCQCQDESKPIAGCQPLRKAP